VSKVVDLQSKLRHRVAEEAEFNPRMAGAGSIIPVLARSIADMRALGADDQMIANTLRFAVEEFDRST
jgi:hypothetical protein